MEVSSLKTEANGYMTARTTAIGILSSSWCSISLGAKARRNAFDDAMLRAEPTDQRNLPRLDLLDRGPPFPFTRSSCA